MRPANVSPDWRRYEASADPLEHHIVQVKDRLHEVAPWTSRIKILGFGEEESPDKFKRLGWFLIETLERQRSCRWQLTDILLGLVTAVRKARRPEPTTFGTPVRNEYEGCLVSLQSSLKMNRQLLIEAEPWTSRIKTLGV